MEWMTLSLVEKQIETYSHLQAAVTGNSKLNYWISEANLPGIELTAKTTINFNARQQDNNKTYKNWTSKVW